mmetsp:Transcript_25732/g.74450  ORF Transcript_25732/g.74450 Transcript_25732/m.74450 type:complete len:495 (-) Transcript_25732:45-1529(-)
MPVSVREGHCFDGSGCDPLQEMDEEDADEYLEEHKDIYMGYLTMDSAPGYALFARLGTQMFNIEGYQCHVISDDLTPVDEEDDEDSEEEGEDGYLEGGIFKTATLPEPGSNMTGFKRPGRGMGLLDNTQLALFRSVDAADILQGGLGDCWLLSAFAAMAEYPNALMGLFQQKTLTESGEYDITLYNYMEGRPQTIRIDDRLPIVDTMTGSQAAYVKPSADGEIWTCLLEKAFATMFENSYAKINGGVSTTAFSVLCGVGSEQLRYLMKEDGSWACYSHLLDSWHPYGQNNFQYGPWPDGTPGNQLKDDDQVHELISQWDENNFIMCANTPAGSDTEWSSQGIVQGHAYTLISARRNIGSIQANLVQVRNPWGKKEWTGDWSDNSPIWDENPDVKEVLKPEASEDGAFWISMEDFSQSYAAIVVVMKDMGANYEKVSNPKVDRVSRVVGAGAPQDLGIELPTKGKKAQVGKRKKRRMRSSKKDKGGVCNSGCSLS